jgi:hypothetical protein
MKERETDTMVHYKADNSLYHKIVMMLREIIATQCADTALRALVASSTSEAEV